MAGATIRRQIRGGGAQHLGADAAVRRICATTSNVLTAAVWSQDLPHLAYTAPCAHSGRYGLLAP